MRPPGDFEPAPSLPNQEPPRCRATRFTLQPRAPDVFEAQGLPRMEDLLVVFKRDKAGRISGLALAPNQLHEVPFRKVAAN